MALTEEQKRKIEEEEEYRAKLRSETSGSEKKKTHPVTGCLAGCILVFLVILGGIGFLVGDSSTISNTDSNRPQVERRTDFKAEVTFTGTQFVITNLDDYDCIGSLMSVNGKYNLDGYTLKIGQSYTVGSMELTEGDNTRFNPLNIKPTSFSIICRGNNELSQATWTGQF